MDRVPWQGKIVDVKGDTIYINAGVDSNIRAGDEFIVYKKGEELIDPDTGISLGSEDTGYGRHTRVERRQHDPRPCGSSTSAYPPTRGRGRRPPRP